MAELLLAGRMVMLGVPGLGLMRDVVARGPVGSDTSETVGTHGNGRETDGRGSLGKLGKLRAR